MQLEDIFLAKYAEVTPDGLFTVVGGGLNRINASRFPWSWGFLFLLARIRLTLEETRKQHWTAVERLMPSGQVEAIGAEAPMLAVSPTADVGPDGKVRLTFNFCLVNVLLSEPGVYRYRLKIDGHELGGGRASCGRDDGRRTELMNQTAMLLNVVPVAGVSESIAPGMRTTWVRASADAGGEAALARAVVEYPLANAELLASVERSRPPQSWYDEDHEGLY
jgi:hypothetical protein